MLRKIRIICGIFLIIFGLIGLILEAANYAEQEVLNSGGVILAAGFLGMGIFLLAINTIFRNLIKKKSSEESLNINTQAKKKADTADKSRSLTGWGVFLLISAIIELLVGIILMLFIIILGIQGFISGEMGTMIGMLSFAVLIFLIPYLFLRFFAIYSLWKRKKAGYFLAGVCGFIFLTAGVLGLFIVPFLAPFLLIYGILIIWATKKTRPIFYLKKANIKRHK